MRVFEAEFSHFLSILTSANLYFSNLAFQNLKSLIVPSIPSHQEVQKLIGIIVDLLELGYCV